MTCLNVAAPWALAVMDGAVGAVAGTVRVPPGRYALRARAASAAECMAARRAMAEMGVPEPPAWRECLAAAGMVLGDIVVWDCVVRDGAAVAAVREPRRIEPVRWGGPGMWAFRRMDPEAVRRCREARRRWLEENAGENAGGDAPAPRENGHGDREDA